MVFMLVGWFCEKFVCNTVGQQWKWLFGMSIAVFSKRTKKFNILRNFIVHSWGRQGLWCFMLIQQLLVCVNMNLIVCINWTMLKRIRKFRLQTWTLTQSFSWFTHFNSLIHHTHTCRSFNDVSKWYRHRRHDINCVLMFKKPERILQKVVYSSPDEILFSHFFLRITKYKE